MTLNVNPAAVGMSAATEVGIAAELAASSGATSEPLLVKTRKGYNDRGELVEFGIARHIASCYQYIVENSR